MTTIRIAALMLVVIAAPLVHAATLRENVDADVNVIRGLQALSEVQLTTSYPINQALAYDYFVPCLEYADHATGTTAQQLVNRDVESDTRNAVIDVYGKLDYHGAYKGRDSLRSRSLDEALTLLSSYINDIQQR